MIGAKFRASHGGVYLKDQGNGIGIICVDRVFSEVNSSIARSRLGSYDLAGALLLKPSSRPTRHDLHAKDRP